MLSLQRLSFNCLECSHIGAGISSIDDITAGILYEALVSGLRVLGHSDEIPDKLPSGMADRHKACTRLGRLVKVCLSGGRALKDLTAC